MVSISQWEKSSQCDLIPAPPCFTFFSGLKSPSSSPAHVPLCKTWHRLLLTSFHSPGLETFLGQWLICVFQTQISSCSGSTQLISVCHFEYMVTIARVNIGRYFKRWFHLVREKLPNPTWLYGDGEKSVCTFTVFPFFCMIVTLKCFRTSNQFKC